MGDRGNIAVKQRGDRGHVFLYSHWGGTELPQDLQKALARRQRWTDPAYLTRIIFDTMTEGQQGEETGYGISAGLSDNEHVILEVDCETAKVRAWCDDAMTVLGGGWSFEEFVNLNDPVGVVSNIEYKWR
jgi:hypothetical protein